MNRARRDHGFHRRDGQRVSRRVAVATGLAAVAATVGSATRRLPARAQRDAATPVAAPSASGDVAGLVDIGGRSLYVEGYGVGSPTVVLLTGYRTSGHYWTTDLLQPDAPRPMVMPGVAAFTRVYTYDRPGTYAPIGDDILIGRSDAIAQPRTAVDVVAELHAVLTAAAIPGPYILAAHSLGGFFARLYAATYPDDVVGMVLVDSYSEWLETVMSPDQFAALRQVNQDGGTDTVVPIPDYGDVETLPWGGDNDVVREATAATPLPPMPLAVLAHGQPFGVPADLAAFTSAELEAMLLAHNQDLATLVPDARFWLAAESGHDIHQDQPDLVIEAIRQVVTGVRQPDTWSELDSCCAP